MSNQDLQSALRWQLEMGVTEGFSDSPVIIAENVLPKKAEAAATAAPVAARPTTFNEPAAAYVKQETAAAPAPAPRPAMRVVADNTGNFLNMSNNEWIKKTRELADNANTLEELKQAVSGFNGLAIIKSATNTVFGEGNPKSKVMFIGEAPGENEDLEGRPFCGLSGQLLDKMLGFIGLERVKNFYITNTLFWRPPGNRKPTPEELAICKPFVEKHIALIKPEVIVLVGGTATLGVLDSKESISVMRKKLSPYTNKYLNKEIPCFAIYHPSFLLRSPSQKKNAWADMVKIKKHLAAL